MTAKSLIASALALVVLAGCYSANDVAMRLGKPPEVGESAVQYRALQTRRYDTLDEKRLLMAATDVMQDLGFTIDESSVEAGVVVGSKLRDATDAAQITGQVLLAVLAAVAGTHYDPVYDKDQIINATMVTTPIENSTQSEVRVNFERLVTNQRGFIWRTEVITDEEIYQEFFNKFSQGTFLEVHAND